MAAYQPGPERRKLSEFLRRQRENVRFTQKGVAAEAGMSASELSRLEDPEESRGTPPIRREQAHALARALGVVAATADVSASDEFYDLCARAWLERHAPDLLVHLARHRLAGPPALPDEGQLLWAMSDLRSRGQDQARLHGLMALLPADQQNELWRTIADLVEAATRRHQR